ncbi:MAG: heme-binding protein, partial [Burkholderiales bacterium]
MIPRIFRAAASAALAVAFVSPCVAQSKSVTAVARVPPVTFDAALAAAQAALAECRKRGATVAVVVVDRSGVPVVMLRDP